MRSVKIILILLAILGVCAIAKRTSTRAPSQSKPFLLEQDKLSRPAQKRIVIAASTLLDGRGRLLHDIRIVVEGSKIVAVETKADPKAAPADYDLRGLTVLP